MHYFLMIVKFVILFAVVSILYLSEISFWYLSLSRILFSNFDDTSGVFRESVCDKALEVSIRHFR